jgi:hypothetical protein
MVTNVTGGALFSSEAIYMSPVKILISHQSPVVSAEMHLATALGLHRAEKISRYFAAATARIE